MSVALVTNYLPPYRLPLYERIAERYGVEVYCFGGEADYVPKALRDLDHQIEQARFPVHKLSRQRDAAALAKQHDVVIASTAGRVALPAAFRAATKNDTPFILWASLWRHPRTLAHLASYPFMRNVYRHSAAVLTYGQHVSRYVAKLRDRSDDVFVVRQCVEPEVFGRPVDQGEVEEFRAHIGLDHDEPIVLFVGRLVPEKGVEWLLRSWRKLDVASKATLCLIGDGPLRGKAATVRSVRTLGRMERDRLPIAYAAADALVVPSLQTRHFLEPWGLVCNEAMMQGRPVIASDAVGAAADGLVSNDETGLVVKAGRDRELTTALRALLEDPSLADRLGSTAEHVVAGYNYDEAADAFGAALAAAR